MYKNMKEEHKHNFLLVLFGVVLFIILQHFTPILDFIKNVFSTIMPLLWGFILAFILNVPMRAIERLIDKIRNRKRKVEKEIKPMNLKLKRAISFSITILLLIGVIAIIGIVVAPKMAESVVSIYNLITTKLPEIIKLLEEHDIDASFITQWIEKVDIKELVEFISQKDFDLFDVVYTFVGSTISGIISLGIALVIAIYALLGKESITKTARKLVTIHFKEKTANNILHISKLIDEKYTKFLSGQCIEACILGTLMFLVLRIMNIPYASLIGVLTAVCAIVPYVGAFLSCFIGACLVLLVKPELIIIYIVAYISTQFIENQFIYPHVVGTSVGLNPLLTIMSVFIGGKVLGVIGMIFFIPLVAVIKTLIMEYTKQKEMKKNKVESVEISQS